MNHRDASPSKNQDHLLHSNCTTCIESSCLLSSLHLIPHFLALHSQFFPKQYTVRGSQCFKEWSPWCWMVWSGSRPPCLPLPPFVSQCFSFPKQFTVRGSQCFKEWSPWCWMVWSGSRPACLPLPFICLPVLFICLPGWVLVVGFPAGLSPTSFHLFPTSFHLSPTSFHLSPSFFSCLPGWVLVDLSSTSFHSPNSLLLGVLNALKNGPLGAGWSGRVPGRLVSHFLSFVSQFFSFVSQAGCLWSWLVSRFLSCVSHFFSFVSHVLSFVSQFFSFVSQSFSFVSQAGCLWSGSRLACLPLPFMFRTSFHLSPTSFHLSPTSFSFVSQFLAGSHFLHLFPTSFHLSPRLGGCGRVPSWLVSHFLHLPPTSFHLSQFFHLSPRLGACSRVPGRSPTSFRLGAWSGSRLACLPLPFICFPLLFICLPGWVLVSGRLVSHFLAFVSNFFPKQFTVRGSPFFLKMCHCWCPPISTGHVAFLIYHFSPRSTAGVRPFPLAMQHVYSFVSRVCHWCCRPFPLAM